MQALQEGFAQPELPTIDPQAHHEAESYWRMIVAAFLRRNPNLARTSPSDEENAFASPRTWDYAIALMTSCDLLRKAPKPGQQGSEVFLNLVEGCIGKGAAIAFVQFLRNLRLPDPEEVLDGKVSVNVTGLRDDELYALFSAMAAELVRRSSGSGNQFVDAMLVFLSLEEKVSRNGKADTIFVPMRQVARGKLLHKVISASQKNGRLNEVTKAMKQTFEGTPLEEFVEKVLVR